MTFTEADPSVTVLPQVLPSALVPDLETIGKPGLTWGGRYWVRTSDLFGVKNVASPFLAGQTADDLPKLGQARTLADGNGKQNPVPCSRECSHGSTSGAMTPPGGQPVTTDRDPFAGEDPPEDYLAEEAERQERQHRDEAHGGRECNCPTVAIPISDSAPF